MIKKLRIITILTTLICMIAIFLFSADSGSESKELSTMCVNLFNKIVYIFTHKDLKMSITPEHYALIEYFFRKLAHMMIYFALSINVMLVLFTFKMKMVMRMLISLIFCFIYACTDEFHQIFVSGRSPQMFDVMIDTSGALFGIMIALIIYCIIFTLYYTYQFKKQKRKLHLSQI